MAIAAASVQQSALGVGYGSNALNTVPYAHQVALTVAWTPPAADMASTHQIIVQVGMGSSTAGGTIPRTHQSAVLVAYVESLRQDLTQRAWTFDLDGHTFYVLTLGMTGTVVYDLMTEQWSEWKTEGYPIWNAQVGTRWRDFSVAADAQQPLIYSISPTQPLDENFRPIRRVVTGLVTLQGRDTLSCDALYMTATPGVQQDAQANPPIPATMRLRFSDDAGVSFYTFGTITLDMTLGTQDFAYRSLGRMENPGRVFEIEDFGGPVRIDSMTIEIPED